MESMNFFPWTIKRPARAFFFLFDKREKNKKPLDESDLGPSYYYRPNQTFTEAQ